MSDKETENENLPDAEYSNKSDFSKAEVVKAQVHKCNEIRSKEMRPGYFNYDSKGNRIYVPDARREWVSAVRALAQLLSPEIKRSTKCQKEQAKLIEGELKAFDNWAIYPSVVRKNHVYFDEKGKKFIPELDYVAPVTQRTSKGGSSTMLSICYVPGYFNNQFHGYWNELVLLYDEWYGQLNILIDENNYFKQGVSF